MADNDSELDRLMNEATAAFYKALRAAWTHGKESGVRSERARLIGIINGATAAQPSPTAIQPQPTPPSEMQSQRPAPLPGSPPSGATSPAPVPYAYGAISRPVRDALRALSGVPGGVDAETIAKHVARNSDQIKIAVSQARTALKVLAKRGEAVRLERGRYKWPEPPTNAEGEENEPPTISSSGSETDGEGVSPPDPSRANSNQGQSA